MPFKRNALLSLTAAAALSAFSAATVAASDLHTSYDTLLSKYVKPAPDGITRVDYARWHAETADRRVLDTYIEQFAYWANLYNALTLKVILDAYPVKSIRDIKSESWLDPKAWLGPWRTQRITVEGRRLSLDNIEHDIMRPTFKDPRVHYAVNCASIGCPNLMPRAWQSATLEADLDAAARNFINHPRAFQRLPDGSVQISSIYRWFIEDFGGNDAGIVAHALKYAAPPLAELLRSTSKLGSDQYDWSLNGAEPGAQVN